VHSHAIRPCNDACMQFVHSGCALRIMVLLGVGCIQPQSRPIAYIVILHAREVQVDVQPFYEFNGRPMLEQDMARASGHLAPRISIY